MSQDLFDFEVEPNPFEPDRGGELGSFRGPITLCRRPCAFELHKARSWAGTLWG
jgi:hypothetical protein